MADEKSGPTYNPWGYIDRTVRDAERAGVPQAREKVLSEALGPWTSSVLTIALASSAGAGLGALKSYLTGENLGHGVGMGAALGAIGGTLGTTAATWGATLSAMMGEARSRKEQLDYERSPGRKALNYLVPGAATNAAWSRMRYAKGPSMKEGMDKKSGVVSELAGSSLWRGVPYAGPLATIVGANTALVTPPRSEARQVASAGTVGANFLPGVAEHNLWKRKGRTATEAEEAGVSGARSKILSETLGPWTSAALVMALAVAGGAGVGALRGKARGEDGRKGAVQGALIGGGVGALGVGAAGLGGSLKALLDPRRTKKEQLEYEESPDRTIMNYLVPGAATHAGWKRLGYSRKYDEEAADLEALDTAERQTRLRELMRERSISQ